MPAYAALTSAQRGQVDYLFADAHFGTDPAAYEYELNTQGDVNGRTAIQPIHTGRTRARQSAPVIVTAIEEVNPTDDMIQLSLTHMDALAASVAHKLFETQSQEVNHEQN
jgi:hypothetical protein